MKTVDLTIVISTLITLVSSLYIFIFGKSELRMRSKKIKPIPLIAVSTFLVTILFTIQYYNYKLKEQETHYNKLLIDVNKYLDSVKTNQDRNVILDSLRIYKLKLENIAIEINKQKKVTGNGSQTLTRIIKEIDQTDKVITSIKAYSEIVDPSIVLPNKKSIIYSGNSSNFEFVCPTDTISEYINLAINFFEPKLVSKMSCILVSVDKISGPKMYVSLFEQTYLPHVGINVIKLKNYFKEKDVVLQVGYILKSESEKEAPQFEKITCRK